MPRSVWQSFTSVLRPKPEADPVTPASCDLRFAFKLFHQLADSADTANVVFSPASVLLCLALVHELASGKTRQAMAAALELGDLDRAALEAEITRVRAAFGERGGATVAGANGVWLGRHAHIADELQSQLRKLYEAELANVDFSSPATVATINDWVSAKTHGKIPGIIDGLSPLSALVAINAVYFKGRWEDPFRREVTREETFHQASGKTKPWPLMRQSGHFRYYEDREVQVIALPYLGSEAMYVALPAENNDWRQFRQRLSAGVWHSWMSQLKSEEGVIKLPRFQVDYAAQLKNAMTALGMSRAFDPAQAEFEYVQTDLPPVWIDQVLHRALAEVNEEGTEAAATTAVLMFAGSAMPRKPPRLFHMTVDRPFLFAIRDEGTKTIQFLGWVGDPQ